MMNEKTFRVRDRRNKGWFFLDNEYLNGYAKIFGAVGTAVYLSLCRHADREQKCFPSERLIGEELSITEKTARKHLRELEKWNLIAIKKERGSRRKYRHNVYYLKDKTEWKKPSVKITDGNKSFTPSVNDDRNQRQSLPTKNTNLNNTNEKKTHSLEAFENFWALYPRKAGKKESIKAWNRLTIDEALLEKIISAIKDHTESDQWKRENGRFIPYPATWLSQERWNDELKITNKSKVGGGKFENIKSIKV